MPVNGKPRSILTHLGSLGRRSVSILKSNSKLNYRCNSNMSSRQVMLEQKSSGTYGCDKDSLNIVNLSISKEKGGIGN